MFKRRPPKREVPVFDGIDPASFPKMSLRDEGIIALMEFREAELRYERAVGELKRTTAEMEDSESSFEYAELRLKRDELEGKVGIFCREKNQAEAEYRRLRPYLSQDQDQEPEPEPPRGVMG